MPSLCLSVLCATVLCQVAFDSKGENRYVIKVMRLNREGGEVPLARENQRMHRAFLLAEKGPSSNVEA